MGILLGFQSSRLLAQLRRVLVLVLRNHAQAAEKEDENE